MSWPSSNAPSHARCHRRGRRLRRRARTRRYGLKVPVLLLDGSVICHYTLNSNELLRLLGQPPAILPRWFLPALWVERIARPRHRRQADLS